MAEEKNTEAEAKPAKTRAPRKRTPKTAAAPAAAEAAPAAEASAKKKPTPRKKAEKKPAETAAPAAPAPAPEAKPAPAPEQPKNETPQHPVHTRNARRNKGEQNAPKPAENPNAKPMNTSEERADSTSEERPLVRNIEQSSPKPMSVPGFATPETVGGEGSNGGNGRRKRRRNRNRRGGEGQQPQQNGPAPRVDADELYRRAWKIFLGEVTEEGLALMDDRTAQEASRRAFRVAELFLLEAARHRPNRNAAAEEADIIPAEDEQDEETEA